MTGTDAGPDNAAADVMGMSTLAIPSRIVPSVMAIAQGPSALEHTLTTSLPRALILKTFNFCRRMSSSPDVDLALDPNRAAPWPGHPRLSRPRSRAICVACPPPGRAPDQCVVDLVGPVFIEILR